MSPDLCFVYLLIYTYEKNKEPLVTELIQSHFNIREHEKEKDSYCLKQKNEYNIFMHNNAFKYI